MDTEITRNRVRNILYFTALIAGGITGLFLIQGMQVWQYAQDHEEFVKTTRTVAQINKRLIDSKVKENVAAIKVGMEEEIKNNSERIREQDERIEAQAEMIRRLQVKLGIDPDQPDSAR